jgi:DNA-directed RNA polymerase specialized sigma subunit
VGMLKSEREYTNTKLSIEKFKETVNSYPIIDGESVKARLNRAAHLEGAFMICQLQDEVEEYEQIKSGKIPKYLFEFENIGLLLIALRIKNGLNQTQVAERLGVPASQISRDENNDYYGVSTNTIKKILAIYNEAIILKLKNPSFPFLPILVKSN